MSEVSEKSYKRRGAGVKKVAPVKRQQGGIKERR